jgi:hypothetical protein
MGNRQSVNKINYEDMQLKIKNKSAIIINTLDTFQQNCLIIGTIICSKEEEIINLNLKNLSRTIIIYGKNCNDEKIYRKYTQLINLGFANIFLYTGGLFEWLCLQDIYGEDSFPTTSKELDILKYKSPSKFSNYSLLTNGID